MFVLTAVLTVLLAAAMAATAMRKLNPDKDSLKLRDRLGVPARTWSAVAVPEALAVLGLLAGLWWAPLGIAAAAGVVLLMLGAIGLHVRARYLWRPLVPPTFVLAAAVLVLVLRVATA